MFAAMLFTISIVALSQFALYYWRAILAGVAAQPVSDRVLSAAKVENGEVTGEHFETFAGLHQLTPKLDAGPNGLGVVRCYFHVVDAISTLAGQRLPAVAAWGQRETAICARYVAVQIDRRLQANLEMAAAIRSC